MKRTISFSQALLSALICLLTWPTATHAQDGDLHYYAQWSHGAGFISAERGRGFPVTGNLNGDGLADFVMPAMFMYHVGKARLEQGELYFDVQATEYYSREALLYRTYLLDLNDNGLDDCLLLREQAGTCCPPFVFYNEAEQLSDDPVVFLPPVEAGERKFPVHLNADNTVDTLWTRSGILHFVDGRTGEVYPSTWSTGLRVETFHDFNADGLTDIMLEVNQSAELDTAATVILLNQGDFSFVDHQSAGRMSTDQYGDFDGDGIDDIIAPQVGSDFRIRTKLLSGNALTSTYDFPEFFGAVDYFVHDLDGDGFSDILVFDGDDYQSYFCHNQGDQTFTVYETSMEQENGLFFAWDPSWGRGNLIAQNGGGRPVYYHVDFENGVYTLEDLTHRLDIPVIPGPGYRYVPCLVDTDQDQNPELLLSTGYSFLHREWTPTEGFAGHTHIDGLDLRSVIESTTMVASGDFDDDGLIDLVYAVSSLSSRLKIKYARPDGTFEDPITLVEDIGEPTIITADINGDGIDDFAVDAGIQFVWFAGRADRQLVKTEVFNDYVFNWQFIDPNGDDLPDLALTSRDSVHIFMNRAGTYERTQTLLGSVAQSSQVGTNQLLLFTAPPEPRVSFVYLDSLGTGHDVFWDHAIPNSFHRLNSFQLDYDGDGFQDLFYNDEVDNNERAHIIYGHDWSQDTTIWFNDRSLAGVIDLNQDGITDLIWQIGPQIFVEILRENPITATSKTDQSTDVRIFPNPTRDHLYLQSAVPIDPPSVQLYRIDGTLLESQAGFPVRMGHLPAGVYLLRWRTPAGEVLVKRVVKQ